MPFQARLLVERMKAGEEGVDFQKDWKVITMFIGGNDLCNYCGDRVRLLGFFLKIKKRRFIHIQIRGG